MDSNQSRSDIDFSKVFKVVYANKRLVFIFSMTCLVLSIVYCIFATPLYTASVIINPPRLTDAGSGLSSVLSGIGMNALTNMEGLQKSDLDATVSLCKTNYVGNIMVRKFNLNKYYHTRNMIDARNILNGETSFILDRKSGFLTIRVEDKNPVLSAQIANYYTVALGSLISNIAWNKTKSRTDFLEEQLKDAWQKLVQAQNDVKDFSQQHGILAGQQIKVVEALVTSLQNQLVVAQTQLKAMSSYATANNPDYQRVQSQITSVKAQLNNLNEGRDYEDEISIPANLAPEYAQQYADLLRNLLAREQIYQVIFKQFQASRIDQLSEMVPTSIEVIDYADVPFYKTSPKRLKIILLATLGGLIISSLFVIVKNRTKIMA